MTKLFVVFTHTKKVQKKTREQILATVWTKHIHLSNIFSLVTAPYTVDVALMTTDEQCT